MLHPNILSNPIHPARLLYFPVICLSTVTSFALIGRLDHNYGDLLYLSIYIILKQNYRIILFCYYCNRKTFIMTNLVEV
jgi:hypothetical protein